MQDQLWKQVIVPLAVFIGSVKLIILLTQLMSFVQRQFWRKKLDLLRRYGGKGTWALVTGSTDGIGLEFAKQLAKQGFNICLVSRTESKLEGVVANDLKNFDVQTRIVVADFSKNAKMDFYNEIMRKTKDLNFGLVVLNAGVSNQGYFEKMELEKLEQMLDVNVYKYAALGHKFGKRLDARKTKRSGLIMVSSIAAQFPGLPTSVVYNATKVFVKYLCQAMQFEMGLEPKLRKDIDLLCLQPGFVDTKMIKPSKEQGIAVGIVSVEECVSAALRDLGHEICTYGPKAHETIAGIGGPLLKYFGSLMKLSGK